MQPTTLDPDDDLDLPALDGDPDEASVEAGHEELEVNEDDGDALDDATAGDAVDHGIEVGGGVEGGLLEGAEDAAALDVGVFDLSFGAEEDDLLEDEAEGRGTDEDLALDDETVIADGGEEGPLAEDEELREEDLPALDADDDGDLGDEALFDRAMIADQDDLRWDDRAWARLDPPPTVVEEADENAPIAASGEDPAQRARDAVWRALEATGRVTAATILPSGGVVVALATPDWARALLVRILVEGTARIIAEIDPENAADGEVCRVTQLRWDDDRRRLVALGSFGAWAFGPA